MHTVKFVHRAMPSQLDTCCAVEVPPPSSLGCRISDAGDTLNQPVRELDVTASLSASEPASDSHASSPATDTALFIDAQV